MFSSLPAGERVYRLIIDAVDGGNRSAEQRAEVYISVTGPDSNPPTFEQRVYRFEVSENIATNGVVGIVRATYAGSSESEYSSGLTMTFNGGHKRNYLQDRKLHHFSPINSSWLNNTGFLY